MGEGGERYFAGHFALMEELVVGDFVNRGTVIGVWTEEGGYQVLGFLGDRSRGREIILIVLDFTNISLKRERNTGRLILLLWIGREVFLLVKRT